MVYFSGRDSLKRCPFQDVMTEKVYNSGRDGRAERGAGRVVALRVEGCDSLKRCPFQPQHTVSRDIPRTRTVTQAFSLTRTASQDVMDARNAEYTPFHRLCVLTRSVSQDVMDVTR